MQVSISIILLELLFTYDIVMLTAYTYLFSIIILGISLGSRQDMYTERLVDSVVGRAGDVMTSSCVVRGDSCPCRWRPRDGTQTLQSMLRS